MSMGVDPNRQFRAEDVDASLRASLDVIYGPQAPLADGIVAHAMGSLALGLRSPEVLDKSKDNRTYAERLQDIGSPQELSDLIAEASDRLRPRIATYLKNDSGNLHPYIFAGNDRNEIIGELFIQPPGTMPSAPDEVYLWLEGGVSCPWNPLGEDSKQKSRYEHGFVIKNRRVYDPLTSDFVEIPYIKAEQFFGERNAYHQRIPLNEIDNCYFLNRGTPEYEIVEHVVEHLDKAIDWYENVYPIAPNEISYGKIKELGYVDENGELLPDWFALMKEHHHDLMWPPEQEAAAVVEPA